MTTTGGLGNVSLNLVDSLEEAVKFKEWLGQRRPLDAIGLDIETGELPGNNVKDALSPWHGKIRLVQVGDGETGWSIPWEEWSGLFYETVGRYSGPIVCHNIAFESKWFATQTRWKFPWHLAHDTMLMSQIIHPNEPARLKTLTAKYVDPMAAHLQSVMNDGFQANGWTWGTVPISYAPYWQYGALDPVITMRLFLDHFYPLVQPGAVYSIPYELEMSVRRIATTMEINGARVDLEYSKKKYDDLVEYTENVKKSVMDHYGTSVTSPPQMVKTFMALGAEITERTPSGMPSLNKDQLDMFVRDGSPEVQMLAQTIIKQRKADKLASSYFLNFQNDAIDGILHPSINIMAARTSRMSITNPALQTLPSGDPTVRRAFLPRNEGESIVSSDLDQVEFRLTACFSGDQALIQLFLDADATGGDVFTSIMRQVYQDDSLQKSDKRRKLIKGVVYGKLYGAGVDKMALTAGVSSQDMQEVVNAFDRTYPGVKQFQKAIEREGEARLRAEGVAYVETKTGRRLPADADRIYSLTNYKIQATAAEVFKMNLVELDNSGMLDYMVVPVHDEIVLSVPDAEIEDAKVIIKECMTTTEGWEVPLTSGVDGPFANWGVAYEDKD